MARLAPLDEHEWSDRARQAIAPTIQSVAAMLGDEEVARPERKKPLNILLTLAHNDQLIGPFLQWAGALAVHGALDRRDAEILALRAGVELSIRVRVGPSRRIRRALRAESRRDRPGTTGCRCAGVEASSGRARAGGRRAPFIGADQRGHLRRAGRDVRPGAAHRARDDCWAVHDAVDGREQLRSGDGAGPRAPA